MCASCLAVTSVRGPLLPQPVTLESLCGFAPAPRAGLSVWASASLWRPESDLNEAQCREGSREALTSELSGLSLFNE